MKKIIILFCVAIIPGTFAQTSRYFTLVQNFAGSPGAGCGANAIVNCTRPSWSAWVGSYPYQPFDFSAYNEIVLRSGPYCTVNVTVNSAQILSVRNNLSGYLSFASVESKHLLSGTHGVSIGFAGFGLSVEPFYIARQYVSFF